MVSEQTKHAWESVRRDGAQRTPLRAKVNTIVRHRHSNAIKLTDSVLLPRPRVSLQTGLGFIQERMEQPWTMSTGPSVATSGPRSCLGSMARETSSRDTPFYLKKTQLTFSENDFHKLQMAVIRKIPRPTVLLRRGLALRTGARYLWLARACEAVRTARPCYFEMPVLASWVAL